MVIINFHKISAMEMDVEKNEEEEETTRMDVETIVQLIKYVSIMVILLCSATNFTTKISSQIKMASEQSSITFF